VLDRPIDRRELLRTAGVGTGALILGGVAVDPALAKRARRKTIPLARGGSFPAGVSCAVPTQHAATLWTRLGEADGDRLLHVEVARDADFRHVVYRKQIAARAKNDYAIQTRIGGTKLKPGNEYFYRFETKTRHSPVGRFKTRRPPDSREPLRIAVFSCQDWQAGYYNAHRAMANEDLDFAISLGDYIYEKNYYDGPRKDRLGANHDGDVQTLDEYRQKYTQYKSDPDLQAMHAAHPYAVIWDDHEVEDNWTGTLPGDESKVKRVPFLQRRANGFRAFYEYHPISPILNQPDIGNDLYRRMRVGANAEFFLIDSRQYRDDQPCGDKLLTVCFDADKPRNFLGKQQLKWLQTHLQSSGATWKLIGNQVMIMALDLAPTQPLNKDSWDGYGDERRQLLQFVKDKGIKDVAFLTGDIHTFFAGDVGVNGQGPDSVATEFVCGSVTSHGIAEELGKTTGLPIPPDLAEIVSNTGLRTVNPHLRFDDLRSKGYGLVEVGTDTLDVSFKGVDPIKKNADSVSTLARFRVNRGSPRVKTVY
jgi:alkaline phosphatase D